MMAHLLTIYYSVVYIPAGGKSSSIGYVYIGLYLTENADKSPIMYSALLSQRCEINLDAAVCNSAFRQFVVSYQYLLR